MKKKRRLSRQFWFRLLFLVGLSVHAIKLFQLLPLDGFVSNDPLSFSNYGSITAQIVYDRSRPHSFLVYDPFHYLWPDKQVYVPLNFNARAAVLMDRVLRLICSPHFSLKLSVFLSLFCIPLMIYFSARLFRFGRFASLMAYGFAVAGFYTFEYGSGWAVTTGAPFVLAGIAAVLFSGAAWFNALENDTPASYGIVWFAMQLAFLWFPPGVLSLAVPFAAVYARGFHRRSAGAHGRLWLTVAAAAVPFALSAISLTNYTHLYPMPPSPVSLVRSLTFVIDYFMNGGWGYFACRLFLLVTAVFGIAMSSRHRAALWFMAWALTVAGLFLVGQRLPYLVRIPTLNTMMIGSLLIYPASAYGIRRFLFYPKHVGFWFGVWIFWFQLTWPLGDPFLPLASGVPDLLKGLVTDLRRVPTDGRVLLETPGSGQEQFALLPLYCPGDYIGTFDFFGKSLSGYDENSLVKKCRSLNVDVVVAFSLRSRSRFDRYSAVFRPVALKRVRPEKPREEPRFPPPSEPYRIYRLRHE